MGLLDFLQAASNTAAQNVAGPIDLLSWALRSAGVPGQEKPMLGSEWMKEKGLMRDVPQSAASLAGETVGLLAPIGAVQFAPQIAAWRNMVNERLAPGAPGKIPTSIPRGAVGWAADRVPPNAWEQSPYDRAMAFADRGYLAREQAPAAAGDDAELLAELMRRIDAQERSQAALRNRWREILGK